MLCHCFFNVAGTLLKGAMLPFAADYDLTGQIIWPAARLLAEYLSENCEQVAHVRDACELGSGLGLAGLICGQFVPTVLTDHNATVLEVLQKNVARNQSNYPMRCVCIHMPLHASISSFRVRS